MQTMTYYQNMDKIHKGLLISILRGSHSGKGISILYKGKMIFTLSFKSQYFSNSFLAINIFNFEIRI